MSTPSDWIPVSTWAKDCFEKYKGQFEVFHESDRMIMFVNKGYIHDDLSTHKFAFWVYKDGDVVPSGSTIVPLP